MKIFFKFFLIVSIFLYSILSISQCIPETPSNPITISASGRTVTYSNISLNGGNNFAELEPGANFTVSFNYNTSSTITSCSGCVTFLYFGVAGASYNENSASPRQNTKCMGSTFGGQSSSQNTIFIAPNEPGYYYISTRSSWVYRCYQYTVSHNNCGNNIGLIKVGNPPPFGANVSSVVNNTACSGSGGSIDIDVTGGLGCYQYLWSNGETSQDISNLSTGSYSVTITDKNCTKTLNFVITEPSPPIIDNLSNMAVCESVQLPEITGSNLVSPAYYTGEGGTGVVYNEGDWINTTGTFYIYDESVTDSNCSDEETFTITVNPIITPTFTQVAAICDGETLLDLSTTSNNGVEGTWAPAIDNTLTTTYTFTPDSSEICTLTQTMTITVYPIITPEFTQIEPICIGEPLEDLPIISNNGVQGTWSPEINNTATTTYIFTPDILETCAERVSFEIIVNNIVNSINSISVEANLVLSSFDNGSKIEVMATGGSGFYEYRLDDGFWQDNPVFNDVAACLSVVSVREKSACSNQPSVRVRLIKYPNFFTPNNDGINDTWNISCLEDQTSVRITIFNRYGKVLHIYNPNSAGWNGTYKGKKLPSSDYWFKIEYLDTENIPRVFVSYFSLARR